MIRKPTLYRRKFRGYFILVLFSFAIFLGVFGVCFGLWFWMHYQTHVVTPLPRVVSQKKSADIASQIQNLCTSHSFSCSNIKVGNDKTASVTIDKNELVIFSLQKDITAQFTSLQLTIAHLTIEGKRFSRLDFRFDKPVVSF